MDHDPWMRMMPQPPPAVRAARHAGYPPLAPLPLITGEALTLSFSLSPDAAHPLAYRAAHYPACSHPSPRPQGPRVQIPLDCPASAAVAGLL